jgi:hypothetical protein
MSQILPWKIQQKQKRNALSVADTRFSYSTKLNYQGQSNLRGAEYISVQAIHPRESERGNGLRKRGLSTNTHETRQEHSEIIQIYSVCRRSFME